MYFDIFSADTVLFVFQLITLIRYVQCTSYITHTHYTRVILCGDVILPITWVVCFYPHRIVTHAQLSRDMISAARTIDFIVLKMYSLIYSTST